MTPHRLWTLTRRCCFCPRPVLLLLLGICLFYQTLMIARSRFRSGPVNGSAQDDLLEILLNQELQKLQTEGEQAKEERPGHAGKATVLTGQLSAANSEVHLYQRVLQQHGYAVGIARYAETDSTHNGGDQWTLLICLPGTETSCLKRIYTSQLHPHQRVNMIPEIMQAFSDANGRCHFLTNSCLSGLTLPVIPSACEPHGLHQGKVQNVTRDERGFFATVKVYVLVASVTPLTAFLHSTSLVRAKASQNFSIMELQTFFLKHLGAYTSHKAESSLKEVLGGVLFASVISNVSSIHSRCPLCFQLLSFTLQFNGSLVPNIVKIETDLQFEELEDPSFSGQILKEFILENVLNFLLPSSKALNFLPDLEKVRYKQCPGTPSRCVTTDERLLLSLFARQMKMFDVFDLLNPASSPRLSSLQHELTTRCVGGDDAEEHLHQSDLLARVISLYTEQRWNWMDRNRSHSGHRGRNMTKHTQNSVSLKDDVWRPGCPQEVGKCVDPHLRQLYTDPPLTLVPPFSPHVKQYRAELPFDTVTIRIRPEPISCNCQVHLDERRGPRSANYPVGLGNSKVSILIVDESEGEAVVMTIYTLHLFRESRPSLPVFEEYVMCGFLQDCSLMLQPNMPCGLEPLPQTPTTRIPQSLKPCESGDVAGRWVVPCLSCSDNRTCDWRVVSWQPNNCYHSVLDQPQLQRCMKDRKVLFIGDSTNRGMMYYFIERVNSTLEDWNKAHDTIIYHDVNHGNTLISYSYYPQFWLEKSQRPTFEVALQQLILKSRPLEDSPQTVLVIGGVQWLNTHHLEILQKVLWRENLLSILVVVKSLGMGFHLPVIGIRSLSLGDVQNLHNMNTQILTKARLYGYEVVNTLSITMGRHKEFLQGKCACHFHEVVKATISKGPAHRKVKLFRHTSESWAGFNELELSSRLNSTYHVSGPINQVYSEILLSRMCSGSWRNRTARLH